MSLPFSIDYLPVANLSALDHDDHVLAAIRFASIASSEDTKKPLFSVGLPNLGLSDVVEVWYSEKKVQNALVNDIQLSCNEDVIFGHLLLDEAKYEDMVLAAKEAYQNILDILKFFDYPYVLRIWNYFAYINEDQSGLERYRQFCLGRQQTLDHFEDFQKALPAATAIGTATGGLQIYFIAAKEPGLPLENPRQLSAFLYPKQYGPVSPAFSRATIKRWNDVTHLYISGTASIVGHESQHKDNVLDQLDETLKNIEALLKHGAETEQLPLRQFTDLTSVKVYLRDLFMLPLAEEHLIRRFGRRLPPVLFLQGDVCRADLLVEIEAAYIPDSPDA